MPNKEPGTSDVRFATSPRLPTFSAAASIGQASRIYRSPMTDVSAGHAVAPSQWAEGVATDTAFEDAETTEEIGEGADTAEAGDASEAMEGSNAEDDASGIDDADADQDSADDSEDGGDDGTEGDEQA